MNARHLSVRHGLAAGASLVALMMICLTGTMNGAEPRTRAARKVESRQRFSTTDSTDRPAGPSARTSTEQRTAPVRPARFQEPKPAPAVEPQPVAPPAQPAAPAAEEDGRSNEERIQEALEKSITVDFEEATLSDVLKHLQEITRLPLHIDRSRILEAGIVLEEKPVTLHAKKIRVESVLNLVLEPLQLGWIIRDEVLQITTLGRLSELLTTRVYDVRPCLVLFLSEEDLAEVLQTLIAPESWDESGGAGTVRPLREALAVRQSRTIHAKIEQFLNELNDFAAQRGADPAEVSKLSVKVYSTGRFSPAEVGNMLQELVDPPSWLANGGQGLAKPLVQQPAEGEEGVTNHALVIRQTSKNHQQVQKILNQIFVEQVLLKPVEGSCREAGPAGEPPQPASQPAMPPARTAAQSLLSR